MDDDEDFEALFFSEARELLDALVEHLNLLADEEGDEETVHAAFRAVHSVKGGAAAFGFDQLISFAHIFETVMDQIREDRLELTHDIAQTLLRSGDMMQVLVENAQAGNDAAPDGLGKLTAELEALAGEESEEAADDAGEPAAELSDDVDVPAVDDAPPAEAVIESEDGDGEDEVVSAVTLRFTPDPEFFDSGHDLLRLIRSARDIGLASVHADGDVPKLESFDPKICPIGWEFEFQTSEGLDRIEQFFEIYSHTAQIEFLDLDDQDDDEDQGVSEDADAATDDLAAEGSGGTAADDAGPAEAEDKAEAAASAPASGGGDTGGEASPAAAPKTDAAAESKPRQANGSGAQKSGSLDANKSLRVEIARIDRLVNLVGEMLITQAAIAQQVSDLGAAGSADLSMPVETMSRQLRELQESVMAIRAQPVKSVFRRMPRVVRDLSEKLGKEARLELFGEHTEVDATVIEELTEPLTHMIRNSMDHGLEPNDEREAAGKQRVGQIRLSAEHQGERVIITIEDDGRGVNRERVRQKAIERGLLSAEESISPEEIDNLIFHPGFSTAEEVSSVSGRGVGMDVVKKKIVSLGGRCSLVSTPGKGTRFEITLPLTLAVMDGMTIRVDGQKYILPLSTVVEALHVERADGKPLPDGSILLERRGDYLKLVSLRAALDLPHSENDREMAIVVDTEATGHVALIVDELIDQRQIVLKSLETNFRQVDGVSGATILGDGQVALILDVSSLIRKFTGNPSMSGMMH